MEIPLVNRRNLSAGIPAAGGISFALILHVDSRAHAAPRTVFYCQKCQIPLTPKEGAATLTCPRCAYTRPVPSAPVSAPSPAAPPPSMPETPTPSTPVADIKHQLKENESQRTEITGHINQLSIQVHRLTLRLQALNERKAELEARLVSTEK